MDGNNWESILVKVFGKCEKRSGKWYSFGGNKVDWRSNKVYSIGSHRVDYRSNKVYSIGGMKVDYSLEQGKEKCFLEEVPRETLVVITYNSLDHSRLGSRRILSQTRDPFDNILVEQYLKDPKGRIALSTEHSGDHKICFKIVDPQEPQTFRMELHIDSGEHAHDYDKLARVEHLSTIEVELRRLNDKIRAIRNEQTYQKTREEEFRDTSESTNSKVVWWSILQTIILVCCGLFQIWHLKRFFAGKKLV